ncbi:putative prophage phiRv2 integrase [Nocardioides sp. LS1]|nr:putative prophage phiRv2 integrase [Nocardioides sp. LS1]
MPRASTGTLRKMKSGRWQARYTFPDGVRRPAPQTFLTKRDANAWLAMMHADVSRGKWSPVEATMAVRFDEYVARWLKERRVRGRPLAARTVEGYESLLATYINPTFGKRPVHTITKALVNEWYKTLPEDKETTRARAYSLLRAILATAVEDEHLTANPAKVRGAGSVDRKHRVTLPTDAQFDALVAAMPDRYKAMMLLAYWCGLRFGELTELRRADVDTKDGIVHVRRAVVLVRGEFVVKSTKSAAGERDVWIPSHVLPALREHLLQHAGPELLFPSKDDPAKHLRQSTLAKVFYKARAKAGLPTLRFHDLRHAHLTKFAQTGATTAEVMRQAGHSTTVASQRYQHAAEDRMREITERMAAGYGGSKQ